MTQFLKNECFSLFTEFTDASNVTDSAGVRLSPYIAYYRND